VGEFEHRDFYLARCRVAMFVPYLLGSAVSIFSSLHGVSSGWLEFVGH
jgi:hypothetical protein